jgi:hypothetical protein
MKYLGVFLGGFLLGAFLLWSFSPSESDSSPHETKAAMEVELACTSVEVPRKWSNPTFKEHLESAARLDPERYLVYLEDYNYLTLRYPDTPISNPQDDNAYLAVSRIESLCDANTGL